MHYGDFIHYHLLGSDEDYLHFSPNNSLIHYVVEWGKAKGKKALHLGAVIPEILIPYIVLKSDLINMEICLFILAKKSIIKPFMMNL